MTVLFTQKNVLTYAGEPGCTADPYDNIAPEDLETWQDIEDLSPVVCSAFGISLDFVVEYTLLPDANEWSEIPLDNPAELCDANGEFTFKDNLKSIASRNCGETFALIITPYCKNGENGVPVVMSFYIDCDDTSEREGTNILARIEDLITETHQEGTEHIFGTPCIPTDIDCIKTYINTVINPYSIPSSYQDALSSKRATPKESSNLIIECYPNPTSHTMNFSFGQHTLIGVERVSLVITDTHGRVIESYFFEEGVPDSLQIDLSEYPMGIYFYRFSINDGIHSGKIIKQ